MAAAQVGTFVSENGPDLFQGEHGQGTAGDHNPVSAVGEAVDGGSIVVEDHHVRLGAGAPGRGD